MNMCSKCFREHQRSNPSPDTEMPPAPVSEPMPAPVSPTAAAVAAAFSPIVRAPPSESEDAYYAAAGPADTVAPPQRKVQKNTSRCFSCRKKIGLTGFKCHCDYVFCSEHRYSDKHSCDFDYQASAREQLEKNNPVVVASKLEKI